jgi:hypothetical protein
MVPFVTAPDVSFEQDLRDVIGNYSFSIHPVGGNRYTFIVESIATLDDARTLFGTFRRGAIAASLNVGCGVRAGEELVVIEDAAVQLPSDPDVPFVCPQQREHSRIILNIGPVSFQAEKVRPRFEQGLAAGFQSDWMAERLEGRVGLACKFYTDSFFEESPESRLLTLIGVLEVLKDTGPVSKRAEQLVDSWLSDIRELGDDEKNSMEGRLGYLKQISVGQGIRRMISRHLGDARAKEGAQLYHVRSQLVHSGKADADLQASVDAAQSIARELLAAILFEENR